MKVCFPIAADEGLASVIHGHFSSAPLYLVVDTLTKASWAIPNCDPQNPFAGCNPFLALAPLQLEAVITGGIGDTAVRLLNSLGCKVLIAESIRLIENLALLERNALQEQAAQDSHLEGRCGGERAEQPCTHHS